MTEKQTKNLPEGNNFISEIKHIIEAGRVAAYSTINATMIATYWNIGKRIVEEEQNGKQRAEYGKELKKN